MVRILEDELIYRLSQKGYECKSQRSLRDIVDSGIVHGDILIEIISEISQIPILDIKTKNIVIENFNNLPEYSKKGYFVCRDESLNEYYVVHDILFLECCEISETLQLALIKKQDFYDLLEKEFSALNTGKALNLLSIINPKATARNISYPHVFAKTLAVMASINMFSGNLFIALNYLIYIAQTFFKMWLFSGSYIKTINSKSHDLISNESIAKNWPIYSILVPMYREEHGVKSIMKALDNLSYPKNRLDIKLVVEEDDDVSLKILNSMDLPEYVHVIKVPYSQPRTKPKALNYAMQYVKGEYLVIYDVEDKPDSNQLELALDVFENSDQKVICVQAKLAFYNLYSCLLARLFAIEYHIWFRFLLPALDSAKMPIPLGGNSNHFRVNSIREIGLWDPYNVTEDADLGVRIFINGYETRVIESSTMEECPTKIRNWLYQRSRWIKGFMQTFLVYWGQASALKEDISFGGKIGIYLFLGFATYSFFIMPWHFVMIWLNMDKANYFLAEMSEYLTLIYMYFTVSIVVINDTNYGKSIKLLDILALLLWPLYFVLHIIASYMALWELLTRPFGWNKTYHAISKSSVKFCVKSD